MLCKFKAKNPWWKKQEVIKGLIIICIKFQHLGLGRRPLVLLFFSLFSFLLSSNLFSYISSTSAYGHGYFRIMRCSEMFFSFSGTPVRSSVDCLRVWRLLGIENSACSFRSVYTRMILRPGTLIMYSQLNANEKKVSLSLKLLIFYFPLEFNWLDHQTTVAWYTCSCVLLPHIWQNHTTKRVFNIIKDIFSSTFHSNFVMK